MVLSLWKLKKAQATFGTTLPFFQKGEKPAFILNFFQWSILLGRQRLKKKENINFKITDTEHILKAHKI